MPLTLTDQELFEQVIEATYPKELLLNVLKKSQKKRHIIDFLGIDLKKVDVQYLFSRKQYSRKYAHNILMFIDKNHNIIGFLSGRKWKKETQDLEYYKQRPKRISKNTYHGKTNERVILKNEKEFWEKAYHVLMFKKEDLNLVKVKLFSPPRNVNLLNEFRKSERLKYAGTFKRRIFDYKCAKYGVISHNDLLNMMKDIILYCSSQLINQDDMMDLKLKNIKFDYYREKTPCTIVSYIADEIGRLKYFYDHMSIDNKSDEDKQKLKEDYLRLKLKLIEVHRVFFGQFVPKLKKRTSDMKIFY